MTRPKTITDEQILEAARELFLEQGYGVTTARIATRAGVSEGTLFKRFKSKEDLFLAATMAPDQDELESRFEELIGKGDLKQNLGVLCHQLIDLLREMLPRIMMLKTHPNFQNIMGNHPDPPPLRALQTLTRFFKGEMKLGRIERSDPEIPARILLGSCNHYVILELHGLNERTKMSTEAFSEGVVNFMWKSLATSTTDSSGK